MLSSFASSSSERPFSDWIDTQVALPPTLHRAYYRPRANPRVGHTTKQGTIVGA